MFNKKNFKKVIITVLALTMILGTVVFAAEGIYTEKLTATYGKIKFNYEGSDVTSQIESNYGTPAFVTEGRAYVPVRAIGDLVGVDIDYDNDTHTVKITDPKVEEHRKQLDDKDVEISKLKAEITKLEKEIKEEEKKEESNKVDIKSLQTSLNKEYGYYRDVEFDILLSRSGNKVNIAITTDFISAKSEYNWGKISYNERKYMVEDIVNQVRVNLDKPDVTGYIYDVYRKANLYSFSQTSNGTLSTSGGGYGDIYDVWTLNSFVDQRFESYGIKGTRLYETGYNTWNKSFEIEILDAYKYYWRDLTKAQKESLLDNVAREIEAEYRYVNDNNYSYITIDIKIGGYDEGTYTRYYNDYYGTYTER